MAKKKNAKKKARKARTSAKTKARRATTKKSPNTLVTGFLRDFGSFLTQDKPPKARRRPWAWPPVGELPAASFATISDVIALLGKAYTSSAVPTAPAVPVTFSDRVAVFANGYPWPTSRDYQGDKPFGFDATTVNLYEIGQVAELMLQAINGGGAGDDGGGGTRWPPVK